MKIEGSYGGLKGDRETVYSLIMDPEILKKCIPGCKELRCIEPDRYWLNLVWGYSGTVVVERTEPPSKLKLVIDGKGNAGTVKASGNLELESREKDCLIKYTGQFFLGGPAAFLQMGASVFGGIPYDKMLRSFFKSFEAELAFVNNEHRNSKNE
jgi:uncharacterized protein